MTIAICRLEMINTESPMMNQEEYLVAQRKEVSEHTLVTVTLLTEPYLKRARSRYSFVVCVS